MLEEMSPAALKQYAYGHALATFEWRPLLDRIFKTRPALVRLCEMILQEADVTDVMPIEELLRSAELEQCAELVRAQHAEHAPRWRARCKAALEFSLELGKRVSEVQRCVNLSGKNGMNDDFARYCCATAPVPALPTPVPAVAELICSKRWQEAQVNDMLGSVRSRTQHQQIGAV
jgi:hypothetical protein